VTHRAGSPDDWGCDFRSLFGSRVASNRIEYNEANAGHAKQMQNAAARLTKWCEIFS